MTLIVWMEQKIKGLFDHMNNESRLSPKELVAQELLEQPHIASHVAVKMEERIVKSHGLNYFNFLCMDMKDWVAEVTEWVVEYVRENGIKVEMSANVDVVTTVTVRDYIDPFTTWDEGHIQMLLMNQAHNTNPDTSGPVYMVDKLRVEVDKAMAKAEFKIDANKYYSEKNKVVRNYFNLEGKEKHND